MDTHSQNEDTKMKVELDQAKIEKAIIDQAVDEVLGDDCAIYDRVNVEISKKVTAALEKSLNSAVEKTLNEIMEKSLDSEIRPVNVWGEAQGEPTTVRNALHVRAQKFWTEKVDSNGKVGGYGGKPRYEHALSVITAKEFDSAVKQNIVNIAGAVKDAVRADFYKAVDSQLNSFFKITSTGDKKK